MNYTFYVKKKQRDAKKRGKLEILLWIPYCCSPYYHVYWRCFTISFHLQINTICAERHANLWKGPQERTLLQPQGCLFNILYLQEKSRTQVSWFEANNIESQFGRGRTSQVGGGIFWILRTWEIWGGTSSSGACTTRIWLGIQDTLFRWYCSARFWSIATYSPPYTTKVRTAYWYWWSTYGMPQGICANLWLGVPYAQAIWSLLQTRLVLSAFGIDLRVLLSVVKVIIGYGERNVGVNKRE